MIPFIGDLTKMDPPTLKADTTDPTPTAYDDNSVGFWARAGNVVWFSVRFIFNSSGIFTSTRGVGAYFWAPAIDGAPPIDSEVYDNSEGRSIVCGAASSIVDTTPHPTNFRISTNGVCEIGAAANRIYARSIFPSAFSNTVPSLIGEGDGFVIAGKYPTRS